MLAQYTGRLYIVQRSVTQHQYKNVPEEQLFPHLKNWFRNRDFVFMHGDHAACHEAESATTYLTIKTFPWAGNNPDIRKPALQQSINSYREIKNSCKKLVESMLSRIRCTIKNKSMHIKC